MTFTFTLHSDDLGSAIDDSSMKKGMKKFITVTSESAAEVPVVTVQSSKKTANGAVISLCQNSSPNSHEQLLSMDSIEVVDSDSYSDHIMDAKFYQQVGDN